ncbi:MAG: sigma 54-interacting transcriptional regulator [Desulfosarcinaceae bacterium]
MPQLTNEERSFFTLVHQAVAANPFSEARAALDLKIAGRYGQENPQRNVQETIDEVRHRIGQLEKDDRARLDRYQGRDREWVQNAFLFDVFHRFIPHFDQLIADQLLDDGPAMRVAFAADAMELLRQRGFSDESACRCFELFFQMRRAYYFIQQNIVGRSAGMVKLRERLWNNVFTHDIDLYNQYLWNRMEDFSTLILGPTGAGKGTCAAAIGRSGYIPFDQKRACFVESFNQAFISLNLSQFSETLIESELFGHKKGAFTGAVENYPGVFLRCSPFGSILLDEIGELSQPLQIKLLQVLQERTFRPVGGHETQRFPGRVIAATNRPLTQLREGGLLRDDFYYRLCSDIISVPSLSQRIREDRRELTDLLAHTVARILGRPSAELTAMIEAQIVHRPGVDYAWPGNVRELEQCVRRILIHRHYDAASLPAPDKLDARLQQGIASGDIDAQSLISGYCRLLYQRHGTFEAVAKRARLDRRTAKKYIEQARQ